MSIFGSGYWPEHYHHWGKAQSGTYNKKPCTAQPCTTNVGCKRMQVTQDGRTFQINSNQFTPD